MSDPFADRPFPRGALLGSAALVAVTLITVIAARATGVGTTQVPASTAVEIRDLRFEDRRDGSVAVYEGDDRHLLAVLEPGTENFIRGVLRGFARQRKLQHAGPEQPFRLTRWADGRLSLDDPVTGRHVDLEAFGPTNAGAFARLMGGAGAGEKLSRGPDAAAAR
ncbi:MAG: photosynthetic complex assembly protein PuhC [Pseudomonadota bacterium]